MIVIEPRESLLGIKQRKLDVFVNKKGVLEVVFRYLPEELGGMVNGLQVQYETILCNESRGDHYHYPDFAGEEFYVLSGDAVLITCNLEKTLFELYYLKNKIAYFVPALIAHKIINVGNKKNSNDDVVMIISKHYNFAVESLQEAFIINHEMLGVKIDELLNSQN